ncbi:transcription factor IIIb, putative [Trypanosoma equiperdum]|uniref:Transcription factor IIIb, putative n=1 Tax=Trypanosoma equiperdum TaxID=5694 RepID=A0A1G4I780_TRYEQ|nr:transcription factor IIIb, putative [Trypanosoma equiperdum]
MSSCSHPTSAQYVDRARGTITCTLCGDIVQDPQLELDPIFARGDKGGRLRALGHLRPTRGSVSVRMPAARPSIEAARRGMATIARQLDVSDDMVEAALGLYKLAVSLNAVSGARPAILCAVLYAMCRRERTSHMVFDFADATGESPYDILSYMHLVCEATRTEVPVIDPSCVVHRFAEQMNLGQMTRSVVVCALKVLRAMHDDWIACGRRPLGVCVAALLVACYMFNIPRSPDEVCGFVRLTAGTISRRLDEFAATSTAALDSIDKYTRDDSSLPPAFTSATKKYDGDKRDAELRQLSAMYYELVAEAKVSTPSTPDRCEKWRHFLLCHCALEGKTPSDASLDLTTLTPQQQLQILGLPNTKPIDSSKARASVKEEEDKIMVKLERVKQEPVRQEPSTPEKGAPPVPNAGMSLSEMTDYYRMLMTRDPNVLDIRRDFDMEAVNPDDVVPAPQLPEEEAVVKTEGAAEAKFKIDPCLAEVLYDNERTLALPWEFIVLQDPELDDMTDLEPYLVLDNEERLRRQKVGEALYGESWNLGAARTKEEIERLEESHSTRKRRREPIREHLTVQDAVSQALRRRGASTINVSQIDELIPGLAGLENSAEDEWVA